MYINIQGRGLKFNNYTWRVFLENVDWENYLASCSYAAVYGALRACTYAKKVPVDYTFEESCDWWDGLKSEDRQLIKESFEAMIEYKSFVDALQKETLTELTPLDAKKKRKMKLEPT